MSARKYLLILLLLTSCGSEEGRQSGSGGTPAAADLDVQPATQSPAQLEERARTAMAAEVLDPASARFANLRAGASSAVCGSVDAKGPDGKPTGFRPFVVSPEGVAVISSASRIMFENPADMFPDFYIRYCAPPEELPMLQRKMAAQLGTEPPPDPTPQPEPVAPGDLPLVDPAPIAPSPPPPPPSRPKQPEPPRAAKSGNEDSFFNAVIRPGEERK